MKVFPFSKAMSCQYPSGWFTVHWTLWGGGLWWWCRHRLCNSFIRNYSDHSHWGGGFGKVKSQGPWPAKPDCRDRNKKVCNTPGVFSLLPIPNLMVMILITTIIIIITTLITTAITIITTVTKSGFLVPPSWQRSSSAEEETWGSQRQGWLKLLTMIMIMMIMMAMITMMKLMMLIKMMMAMMKRQLLRYEHIDNIDNGRHIKTMRTYYLWIVFSGILYDPRWLPWTATRSFWWPGGTTRGSRWLNNITRWCHPLNSISTINLLKSMVPGKLGLEPCQQHLGHHCNCIHHSCSL